mgnify:CR=1 FL=1
MYAKRIIPCLDVKNGRVVKGMSFVNLVDAGDPVESAMQYDKQGADELVFLDITASSDSRNITIDMVERLQIQFSFRSRSAAVSEALKISMFCSEPAQTRCP